MYTCVIKHHLPGLGGSLGAFMSMAFLAFSSLPAFALFGTSGISFFLPLATLIMSDWSTLLLPESGARQTVLKEGEITYRLTEY